MAQPKATAKQATFLESLAAKHGIGEDMGKKMVQAAKKSANSDTNYWTEAGWGEWRKMSRREASAIIDIILKSEW